MKTDPVNDHRGPATKPQPAESLFSPRAYFVALVASVRPVIRLRPERLWEIDAWRGVAIIMMVIYHLMWDLDRLGGYDIGVRTGFWRLFQIATAGLFTILVGLSLTLSYNRARESQPTGSLWSKYLVRGAVIFTWGMVVSIVTLAMYGPDRAVRFGILHLIGLSIVIAYPLLRYKWLNLGLAAVIIAAGYGIRRVSPNIPLLEWLAPTPGHGVDYQPLIPMFGRVLIGIFLGNLLYPGGKRRFRLPDWQGNPASKSLRWLGQNALLIYLVHQPILVLILVALGIAEW